MTRGAGGPVYWAVVAVLWVVGMIGIFSVGMPFLLLGITLVVVSPWRSRPAVLWPAVTAVVAFLVGFVLVAPLGCTATASSEAPVGTTTCTNLLGIDYSGPGVYNPSLLPALFIGLGVGILAAALVRVRLARRDHHRPSPPETTPVATA